MYAAECPRPAWGHFQSHYGIEGHQFALSSHLDGLYVVMAMIFEDRLMYFRQLLEL